MNRIVGTLVAVLAAAGLAQAQALKIYTEISAPSQIQGPNGKLEGVSVELVQEIQKRVGSKDPIQVVPWARGYQEAQSDPNVALFSMARNAERNSLFQWVGPLLENSYLLYVKADSKITIKTLEDAKKLKAIGVYRNDVRDQFLTKQGFTNLDRADDSVTNFKKLELGRIDAIAGSNVGMTDLAKAAGFNPEDLKPTVTFMKVQTWIAFSKATPAATVKAWAEALEAVKKDKTYEKIYRKYMHNIPLPGPAITSF